MATIAALAILLGIGAGLAHRGQRFEALSLRYSQAAARLERGSFGRDLPPGEIELVMEEVHWLDAVASEYKLAAARPWGLRDPDPRRVICGCCNGPPRKARVTR
jgi:hypothetical protein